MASKTAAAGTSGMRIIINFKVKHAAKTVFWGLIILSAMMAVVFVSLFRAERITNDAFIICMIVAAIPILSILYLWIITSEYVVDQSGITKYGCFGKVKTGYLPWEKVSFVGVAAIKTAFRYHLPVNQIFCSQNPPQLLYRNSVYYVPPKGKKYCLMDTPEAREILRACSPHGFCVLDAKQKGEQRADGDG